MAEVATITVLDSLGVEREVPTLLSVEAYLDGLEGLIGTTNTTLTTIDGRVDGLETLINSTNTKLDTAITSLQLLDNVTQTTGAPTAADTAFVVGIHPDSVNANGQQTMANSAPVTIASDQSAVASKGNLAHDAADTSNPPVKTGAKATSSLAALTLVSSGDVTDSFAGLDGVRIVRPHCNLEDIVSGVAAITDGSSTSVLASAGAGVKNYVTSIMIANTSATAVTVDLRDGAAGTVKATLPVPANTSGVVTNLPVPLGFSAATAVCADPSASASTITVTLIGFKSKV